MWHLKGVVLRQGVHEHEDLNVKGSSIAPPSDTTPDLVVSTRNPPVDMHRDSHFDDMSLNWGRQFVLFFCYYGDHYFTLVMPMTYSPETGTRKLVPVSGTCVMQSGTSFCLVPDSGTR